MLKILEKFLSYHGIKFTKIQLTEIVKATPYSHTLFGICQVLSKYGVTSEFYQYPNKQEVMTESLPTMIIHDNKFAFVTATNENSVRLRTESEDNLIVPLNEFSDLWDGKALLLYIDKLSGEPDFEEHRRQERLARVKRLGLVGCVAICVALGLILSPLNSAWYWWALLAINAAGIGVSVMLLQKQLHIPNKLADRLCGLVKESHCEAVTQSEGADFFGLVKLSEIGSGFFAVNTLALLYWPQSVYFLALVSVCVLPFTFWSVWYQKKVAKSWCVLCLCTLALMWLQAGIYFAGGVFSQTSHQWTVALGLVAVYAAGTLLLNKLMKLLDERNSASEWHMQFNTLKAQDKVIDAYEEDASVFATDCDECSSLVFGNPDAVHQITIFSNPYCGPCAKMHERIQNMPGDGLCVRYVMTYFTDEKSKINRYIIAAYQQLGQTKTWDLMTQWYAGGKALGEEFFNGLGLDPYTEEVAKEFEKHERWRNDDRLVGTPTVIVNGKELVGPYGVEDYIYVSA